MAAGGRVVEVEVICSDRAEHRRRAEERVLDVPGLAKPSWDPLVLDTAVLNVGRAVQRVLEVLEA